MGAEDKPSQEPNCAEQLQFAELGIVSKRLVEMKRAKYNERER